MRGFFLFAIIFFVSQVFGGENTVAPTLWETNRHIGGSQVWDFSGKWGPYPSVEAACRAEVYSPHYTNNNYRGHELDDIHGAKGVYSCFCHSNSHADCGYAYPVCALGTKETESVACHTDLGQNGAEIRVCRPLTSSGCPAPEEELDVAKNNECTLLTGPSEVGNPVNMFVGNKVEQVADYVHSDELLSFFRYYSSAEISVNPEGILGSRWRHSFHTQIVSDTLQGELVQRLNRPSGNSYVFREKDAGWMPDADVRYQLEAITENGLSAGWRVRTPDNHVERFDASGRLTRITEFGGDSLSLIYDSNERLIKVEDRRGRALTFTYANNHLATVTRPDGLVLEYVYSDGQLAEVRYPVDGTFESLQYLYEDINDAALLTGIIDENGQRYATWEYDGEGRAISSWHGGSGSNIDKVTLAYGDGETLVTHPLGNTATYGYEVAYGRAKLARSDQACSDCGGGSVQARTYDANGYPDQHTDFNGHVTDYDYNASGQQVRMTEGLGAASERTVEQDWHGTFNVPLERRTYDAAGTLAHKTTWTRNSRGQPLTRTDVDPATGVNRSTTTTYCEQSDATAGICPLIGLATAVDGAGTAVNDITTYGYYMADHVNCGGTGECLYRRGDLHTVTNGLGQTTEFLEYDGTGRPERIEDVNGIVTEFEYDDRDRMIRRTVAAGLPEEMNTTFDYDAVGQLTRVTLPNGAWIGYEYDAAHRLTALEDALGNRVNYTLDAAGNRIAEEVSGSSGTVFRERTSEYDQLSRLVADINGVGDRTEHDYDAVGNRSATEDAASNVTTYAYDALNRLTEVTDALNGETAYEYDALDNLTQVTDPRGVVTTYDHNAFGDVLAEHSPDAGTTTYTYDAAGNRLTRTDARGVTATYSYDALNRVTGIDYPGNEEDIQYTYDQGAYGKGRLTGFTGAGGATTLTYDPRGNVLTRTRSTGGNSFTMQYEYDLADNVTAIVYPSGLRVELTRDAMGRITALDTTVDGAATSLASQIHYQPFGGITGLTYGNGLTQTRQHDLAGRLVAQAAPPVQGLGWTYSNTSNITGIQDQVTPAKTQTFSYDALNRLTDASGAYGTLAYQYDAAGNRTQRTEDGQITPYGYAPDSNRLTTIDGQSVPYDATGNILTLAGDDFTYGARNRRQTTERNGTLIAEYEYNALGQRTHKSNAGTETHFVHGRNGQLIGEYDISGQAIREYVYLEGEPLAMIHQGAVYYFHNDQLGSPLKLTDNSQNVAWDGVRAPFGETSVTTNAVENPLRFPGQYFDAETGLHQNWFRDYDPGLGRYIQSDPIGLQGGLNTYFYVNGNPLIYSDPLGLLPDWLEKAKKNRQKNTYTEHRTQRPKEHDDIFKSNKKRNKQKKEKRQLNDICKDYDIKDRNDFGEFLEEWKPDNGYRGGDTLPYEVLRKVAKEYKGL